MLRLSLNGQWVMRKSTNKVPDKEGQNTAECISKGVHGRIPGSVYSFLLGAGLMEDPYYRDRELEALRRMEEDYTFSRVFIVAPSLGILTGEHQCLRFEGIDTLSEVRLNGVLLGRTDNMHITWEFDVRGILQEGKNTLEVTVLSPTRFIRHEDREYHLGGSYESMRGFPHLRKAHCMFGWDWGPRLPDGGIWRDVWLEVWNESRIEEVRIRQRHFIKPDSPDEPCIPASGNPDHAHAAREGRLRVELTVDVVQSGSLPVSIRLTGPDGFEALLEDGKPFVIDTPEVWWPNGLGAQPLYEVEASLLKPLPQRSRETATPEVEVSRKTATPEVEVSRKTATPEVEEVKVFETQKRRIGLRTLTMRRDKDEWGESFAMEVNGQCVFSMGADYIPEDNILSRMDRERTRALLENCRLAHFNVIRVWGGGFYPADWFYDLCDEMGLVVWQDMMFACANYRLTDDFVASIRREITQNVRRIRHHASLGIWCGNNEMEQFALVREFEGDDITAADYLIQNEFIIPEILKKEDPDTFYWPSSPSSGGRFDSPQDPDRGDVHFWDVWHAGKPFTEYRKYHFRYLSEFGFQSFPCIETVRSFTEEEDRNIFSYVMEMHQRNAGANGKILQYLSATYRYPEDFETLLYTSQLLQADAIRYGVEHLRRNRDGDRCMGAVYWQLNDIWPVASWSSIDYYHRWKALQYSAVRFFAPVLLSCEEESMVSRGETCIAEPQPGSAGETFAYPVSKARLNVSNETWERVTDEVIWELRAPDSTVISSGRFAVDTAPFSTQWFEELDFSEYDPQCVHLNYYMGSACGGSVLFVPPKHYRFRDPALKVSFDPEKGEITITSAAYARYVEVYSEDGYIRTDDNFFDMEAGTRTVKLLEGSTRNLKARSVYDIR